MNFGYAVESLGISFWRTRKQPASTTTSNSSDAKIANKKLGYFSLDSSQDDGPLKKIFNSTVDYLSNKIAHIIVTNPDFACCPDELALQSHISIQTKPKYTEHNIEDEYGFVGDKYHVKIVIYRSGESKASAGQEETQRPLVPIAIKSEIEKLVAQLVNLDIEHCYFRIFKREKSNEIPLSNAHRFMYVIKESPQNGILTQSKYEERKSKIREALQRFESMLTRLKKARMAASCTVNQNALRGFVHATLRLECEKDLAQIYEPSYIEQLLLYTEDVSYGEALEAFQDIKDNLHTIRRYLSFTYVGANGTPYELNLHAMGPSVSKCDVKSIQLINYEEDLPPELRQLSEPTRPPSVSEKARLQRYSEDDLEWEEDEFSV